MYSCVLFDFDHMLFDSNASEEQAFNAAAQHVGLNNPHELFPTYAQINGALWAAVERGEITPVDVQARRFVQLVEAANQPVSAAAMAEAFIDGMGSCGELYPGAIELLELLEPTVTMAMVTNGLGRIQRARIDRLGLDRFFPVISISGELAMSKPSPEIFDHTLRELGVTDRSAVVMVGDSLSSDIAGGIAAGVDTIWFNPHGTTASTSMPTHEVSALDEIAPLILG